MPFSTAENESGARLIGADRATWVRLAVAIALGAAAFGAPRIGGTAATFTDSTSTTLDLETATDFSTGSTTSESRATPRPTSEPTTEPPAPAPAPSADPTQPPATEEPPATDG